MIVVPLLGLAAAVAGAAEACAVERIDRRLRVPELRPGLAGLRIAHVSDLHLGARGVNATAARRAIRLVREAEPDLIAITGDLLSRPSGTDELLGLLGSLTAPLGVYATLGNHDVDVGDMRDPFCRFGEVPDLASVGVELLRDRTVSIKHGGVTIAISGIDPRDPDLPDALDPSVPWPTADASLHVILAHYPDVFDGAPSGARGVILTGHLHGGQICLPWPNGRLRLSQLGHRYTEGIYEREGLVMHISRGVGTTFVPFRVFARPEVTVLELVA